MTCFARESIVHSGPTHPSIDAAESSGLHQHERSAGSSHGVPFRDSQTGLVGGYSCCNGATQALIAPTERIRALLATLPVKR
jgi:hypothetical protein